MSYINPRRCIYNGLLKFVQANNCTTLKVNDALEYIYERTGASMDLSTVVGTQPILVAAWKCSLVRTRGCHALWTSSL
ncbi:hypothetical protein [Desulfosporosinus sp. Sb-LF]|uniref:hypothetical protein n=1 Tax=Desulfosporosinus sp. Sb-LF TaxID=2560027 RepID=UPI00107F8ACB|nr:hypothetical protein [Desulfosporosinus sp. Sb-LF]TGE31094.1 hypothetical protein E4K68_19210 [Desulfosporosinus sp. Sb-LF]